VLRIPAVFEAVTGRKMPVRELASSDFPASESLKSPSSGGAPPSSPEGAKPGAPSPLESAAAAISEQRLRASVAGGQRQLHPLHDIVRGPALTAVDALTVRRTVDAINAVVRLSSSPAAVAADERRPLSLAEFAWQSEQHFTDMLRLMNPGYPMLPGHPQPFLFRMAAGAPDAPWNLAIASAVLSTSQEVASPQRSARQTAAAAPVTVAVAASPEATKAAAAGGGPVSHDSAAVASSGGVPSTSLPVHVPQQTPHPLTVMAVSGGDIGGVLHQSGLEDSSLSSPLDTSDSSVQNSARAESGESKPAAPGQVGREPADFSAAARREVRDLYARVPRVVSLVPFRFFFRMQLLPFFCCDSARCVSMRAGHSALALRPLGGRIRFT
jgi:hypothetical protein